MDRDKLHKAGEDYYLSGRELPYETILTFEAGADWLMQQPLSERLTDEEKEKIIKKYKFNDEAGLATAIRTGEMANKYILKRDLLEDIFGEKLFNDK